MLKRFILVTTGVVVLYIAGWHIYELRLAYIDHRPYIKATQDEMVDNFHENKDVFYYFREWGPKMQTIEDFRIENNSEISFNLSDSLGVDYSRADYANFFIGEHDMDDVEEVKFLDSDIMQVLVNDEWKSNTNWELYYSGEKDHEIVGTLLSYHNIKVKTLDLIINKLFAIDCKGFSKIGDIITIVYRGIPHQSLNYIIPLNDSINELDWTKIEDGFYIELYESGWNCDVADWYNY